MIVLIDMLKKEKKYPKIDLCYVEDDEVAKKLYEGLGFTLNGIDANEVLMEMKIVQ